MEKIRPTDVRKQAWDALSGFWGVSAFVAFVMVVIMVSLQVLARVVGPGELWSSWISMALSMAIAPISIAGVFIFQDLLRNSVKPTLKALLSLMPEYLRYVSGMIWVAIYTFLWMLLLIIPGLIKSVAYSMTYFIMRDNPGIGARAAITRSQKMMKGHKMELFLMQLSFIGWVIIGCITVVGLCWLLPYTYTAFAAFYERIKEVEN